MKLTDSIMFGRYWDSIKQVTLFFFIKNPYVSNRYGLFLWGL